MINARVMSFSQNLSFDRTKDYRADSACQGSSFDRTKGCYTHLVATRRKRKPDRALVARLDAAGRALSTAAVMFHTVLAGMQGLSATEEKARDFIDRFGPLTAREL